MKTKEKNKDKVSIKNFKLLWQYLKKDRLLIIIYFIFEFLMFTPSITLPYVWGLALEALIIKDLTSFIKYMVIYTSIQMVIFSLLMILTNYIFNYLEIKFIKAVNKDLYKKINDLPARAFEEVGVGEFVNRLSSDPDTIISLLSRLIDLTIKSLIAIVVLIVCVKTSWILGIEIVVFAIIMGVISGVFFPKIKKEQEKIKEETDKYVKYTTENISGIREIKSLGIKEKVELSINKILDELYLHTSKIRMHEETYFSLNNLIYHILQGTILITTGVLFIKGEVTYSLFIMIEAYIWRVDNVVESISEFGVNLNKVLISLKRIDEILNNKLYKPEKFGNVELTDTKGTIEFKNVSFRYTKEEDYTLNKMNLSIVPNKKIAIVGKSGNGKSTIFNLLLRYFDATKGKILIDGINIEDLSEETLRKTISIIRQTPFLFNVSIMENFTMVDENITLEQVREYCKKAYIDDYIMSLPNKYNTIIGEGGVNLSGGQKQRLAIARTLMLNTKIILFDEATSALDNESQDYIKKTIDNLVVDHTIVIIAHRLSTIIDADIINVIDKGSVVGTGTHKELLKSNEIYKKLYNSEI